MKTNDKTTREAQLSIDRVHTILARITWALRTNDFNSVERHIDVAICEMVKLAEIASKGKSTMSDITIAEGDKIAWSAIVNGKIVRLKGDVSSIVGETMCCIGKCIVTGNWWRDYVSIHDKSISRL